MKKDNFVYLQDSINACEKIRTYIEGFDENALGEDTLTQDAIIRNIIVIGEATNKLTEDFKVFYPEFPVKGAITMRNKLVHDYSFVDREILWDTVTKDIPDLLLIAQKISATYK